MRLPSLRLLLTAATLAGTAAAADAAAAPDAETLAGTCAGCHGPDGASLGPATPTIAALSTDYFVLSMKDYQSGKRPSTVMGRIAKAYTDEQIQAMAAHFQAKPFVRADQPVDPAKAQEGRGLAKKFCESCHEDEGRLGDGVGVLAGQKLPYMEFAMEDFLNGARAMEKRQARKYEELKAEHGDRGFDVILHYYASVK
ncbi:c-type cytochrome [Azospirillum sp. ST 5-10]|uniref:c-type cytochrome n=1 Tax=unclassified Azospirillum TaxID=2630922 RepID=UPI003F4A553E